MAWTYSDALLLERDRVRLLVGDTEASDPQLTDEALDFLLSVAAPGSTALEATAAAACRALAAKYARRVDLDQGGLSISASQRAARYSALAAELQGRVDKVTRLTGSLTGSTPGALGLPGIGGAPVIDLAATRANRAAAPDAGTAGPGDPLLSAG